MSRRTNTRERLLDAAAQIVARQGAANLTIDAVAAQAGLSKGGVLYHFPSKRDLLTGMLNRLLTEFQNRVDTALEATGSLGGAWVTAEHEQSPRERAMTLALLANAAEDPSLLDPARSFVAQSLSSVRKAGREDDLITILAVEGLRFLGMLDLLQLSSAERRRLHNRLLALSGSASS